MLNNNEIEEPPNKKRFLSLNNGELDSLLDSAQSQSTKYNTAYAVSVFKDWALHKEIQKPLHEQSKEELNETFRVFYAEVRNKNGEEYGKSTLMCLRSGIERHLNFPPYNRGLRFSQDSTFKTSNMMLDAKIKKLKREGKQDVNHKPAIAVPDLQKLKVHPVLSPSTPLGLLRNVWFHTTLFWCRRGREGQRRLTSESFKFLLDENSRPYATMAHDESSKNHPGGISDPESFEKSGRMYKTSEDPSDGYNALRFYISKLNPNCEAFYQYPRRKWSPESLIWFENRPLGVNKLGCMMKEISQEAQLSQLYTNHCVRATAITLWSDAGPSNRHIMAISGHRNEQSLKSYNSRPSSMQLQQSSDVLLQREMISLFSLKSTNLPSVNSCRVRGHVHQQICPLKRTRWLKILLLRTCFLAVQLAQFKSISTIVAKSNLICCC